jgi:hypothetical protein
VSKHALPVGLVVGVALVVGAALLYPGGSSRDALSRGFDLRANYVSDLFPATAVDGEPSASRLLAIPGMLVLCATFALFFLRFAGREAAASSRRLVGGAGVGAMVFAFLAVTPWHHAMITAASACSLLALFVIVVSLAKAKRHVLAAAGAACLAVSYLANYVYFARQWLEWLPMLQKVSFAMLAAWVVAVDVRGHEGGR